MTDILTGTELFMRAAGQPIPDRPAVPAAETIALRLSLLVEEVNELCRAVGFDDIDHYLDCAANDAVEWQLSRTDLGGIDIVEMVDAFHDIVVVAHGGALETAGSDATKATAAEVTRSNLDKVVDGKVLRREDQKIMKPENWTPPQIAAVLEAYKLSAGDSHA